MELLGKSKEELRAMCAALGEPAYRAGQIYHALYVERKLDLAQMTNLPAGLQERLASEATITVPRVKRRFVSQDGSVRYLFELGEATEKKKEFNTPTGSRPRRDSSGQALTAPGQATHTEKEEEKKQREKAGALTRPAAVEAVFMPSEGRQTICISTQAGCAVDCHFCLTAQLGLLRNLTAGEILAQVLLPLEEHKEKLAPRTNVVLMGQGEPLLNFDAVMAAMRILLDQKGMALAPRHVTLSTSGIVPGIERLGKEKVRPKLAISLNASHDEQRDTVMPINKKYPLGMLLEACRNYPRGLREYITFEYVLLGGVNDAAEDARQVARLLATVKRVKVNLIPWNPGELPYAEPCEEKIKDFHGILLEKGIPTFVRYSRGRDVMAACGQLALKEVGSSELMVIG